MVQLGTSGIELYLVGSLFHVYIGWVPDRALGHRVGVCFKILNIGISDAHYVQYLMENNLCTRYQQFSVTWHNKVGATSALPKGEIALNFLIKVGKQLD